MTVTQLCILTIAVLLGGLTLAAVVKHLKLGDSKTFLALLLAPLIVLGVASGKVRELTGPGGIGAKFMEVAHTQVSAVHAQLLGIVDKTLQPPPDITQHLTKNRPVALSLTFGTQYYTRKACIAYIEALRLFDEDMTVLILNSNRTLFATSEAATFLRLLENESLGEQIIDAIRSGESNGQGFLETLPGVTFDRITEDTTNIAVLKQMRQNNTRSIVVVDQGIPLGIVKRDDIVSEFLEKLAGLE